MKKLNATMKIDGNKVLYNKYDCVDCKKKGIEHQIIDIPGKPTDRYSTWGSGVATTMRQCTACKAKDGPWVSAGLVGDY